MVKLGFEKIIFKIPYCRTVFNFSCKTSVFCGAGCFFGGTFLSIFCHFFMQNFSFLRGWEVFLSKKIPFFSHKILLFEGLGSFLGEFVCHFCVIFSCKMSVFFWQAGSSFWVKKYFFFRQNFSFCGAECSFWVKKRHFFEIF